MRKPITALTTAWLFARLKNARSRIYGISCALDQSRRQGWATATHELRLRAAWSEYDDVHLELARRLFTREVPK